MTFGKIINIDELNRDGNKPPPVNIHLVPFDQIKLGRQRRYLVKGIIPRVGLTVVWGPPKCGKSFWVFDMLMHVALDWEYRGRRVQQGPVVYCAFEGQSGFEARVEAFRQRFMGDEQGIVPFYLEPVQLSLARDHRALIAAVSQHLGDVKPAAVCLDTLNRSLEGSESSDEDMTAYIKAADAIREAFECAVIVVHHCGIDGTRPRGHTSLTGAVDAQLSVKKNGDGNIVVTVECAKDGAEGEIIASRLESVDVGLDEDGEAITSCIVTPSEAPDQNKPKRELNKNQQTMYAILHDAGSKGLSLEDWNERAREAGIGIKRKADLYDIRSTLQKKGMIYEGTNGWCVKAG